MFRERIQGQYEVLSPRFRALADFILENTLDVGFMTATELARRVGVDPATVVRFSQELGYSGYRELSREIKDYINRQLALRYRTREAEGTGVTGEVNRLIDELSARILDMKVDAPQIGAIVELVQKAGRVIVTGAAVGLNLAELWALHLQLIGLPAQFVGSDPAEAALALRGLSSDDLVIAIASGLASGTELGHVLSTAIEMGARTISITASPTLLPARQADVNLVVPTKTASGYPSFDTVAAVLSILWQALIAARAETSDAAIEGSMAMLMKLVEQRDTVPPYDRAALLRLWERG